VIGVIQAATSINEQTLSFVPKLVIVLGVFALLSGYVLSGLTDYFAYIFEEIRYIQ
jgi:flagellar biosynthetic protein FliQ